MQDHGTFSGYNESFHRKKRGLNINKYRFVYEYLDIIGFHLEKIIVLDRSGRTRRGPSI